MINSCKRVLKRYKIARYAYVYFSTLFAGGAQRAAQYLKNEIRYERLNDYSAADKEELDRILHNNTRSLIVSMPLVDWEAPLYQRSHHMARHLSWTFLYLYVSANSQFDTVDGFQEVSESLFLTNKKRLVLQQPCRKILHLCSTDNYTTWQELYGELERGNIVLYEYIDEISAAISCGEIPERTYVRHQQILQDVRCIVIATADKLLQEVAAVRSDNYCLVTNGVDIDHFSVERSRTALPDSLLHIVSRQQPIIGYFGALASWFDYQLLIEAAQQRPEYQFVLIGFDYDSSLAEHHLDSYANIHLLGPIPYQELPAYACWFDVATIPFLVNEITESTSPIKLFEYMALGLPIVTTAMPECRKYRPVLVAADHGEFIAKLDDALALRNDGSYQELLRAAALDNSWESKAQQITIMIDNAIDRQWGESRPGSELC